MGRVVEFPEGRRLIRSAEHAGLQTEPAHIIILPVVRIERHPDELCPRVGFIVTKLGTAGRAGRRLLQPSRNADHDQTYALSRLRSHSFLDNIVAS